MNIVSTSNDQYSQHLGVMLQSLFENTINKEQLNIFIIDGGISEKNKKRLNMVANKYSKEITFLRPNLEITKDLPENSTIGYITNETYYRIILPKLLGKRTKKVLYIDCDVIITGDIGELWNTDLKQHVVAAVDESCSYNTRRKRRLKKELGLSKKSPYFNAGVLLLNFKKWRKEKVSEQLINYLSDHPNLTLMDQDALNVVLNKEWLQLDYKWNYTPTHWDASIEVKPVIIHFAGWKKPWNSEVRYKDEYFKYLQTSLWNESENL
ncbi:glycosyltransferase family 8 protein [Anaerobacillus alkaliphilus]|uniref:glycosyltransferase family 8 protein n=1 Tax=Anaerobacillus alkaliphilus TaxID=1548597 RepID=UPI001376009E|nr:glycosyltransferase family 8 protein [Anaerobacillus alkaliphilus]